jgi:hypothetical protein
MGIEVSAPVAGVGGGLLLAGGGTLAVMGRRQLTAATALSQFATPYKVLPAMQQLDRTLAATDGILTGVQTAMNTTRLPGEGLLRRVPFLGSAADDLERAVRIGAAAKELSKLDETVLISNARKLSAASSDLIASAEDDIARFSVAKASAMSGGTKLLIGGAVAAVGAFLLANAIFDFD